MKPPGEIPEAPGPRLETHDDEGEDEGAGFVESKGRKEGPGKIFMSSAAVFALAGCLVYGFANSGHPLVQKLLRSKGVIQTDQAALAAQSTGSANPKKSSALLGGNDVPTESDYGLGNADLATDTVAGPDPQPLDSAASSGATEGATNSSALDSLMPRDSLDKLDDLPFPDEVRSGEGGPIPVPKPRFTLADVIVSAADEETAVKIGNMAVGELTSRYKPSHIFTTVYVDVEAVTSGFISATFRGVSTSGKLLFGGTFNIENKGTNADISHRMGNAMQPQIDKGLSNTGLTTNLTYFSTFSSARVFARNEVRPRTAPVRAAKRK